MFFSYDNRQTCKPRMEYYKIYNNAVRVSLDRKIELFFAEVWNLLYVFSRKHVIVLYGGGVICITNYSWFCHSTLIDI